MQGILRSPYLHSETWDRIRLHVEKKQVILRLQHSQRETWDRIRLHVANLQGILRSRHSRREARDRIRLQVSKEEKNKNEGDEKNLEMNVFLYDQDSKQEVESNHPPGSGEGVQKP